MPLSRRSFVRALGFTGAGIVSAPLIGARGHEAWAAELARGLRDAGAEPPMLPAEVLRLASNENPRGPGAAALEAVRAMLSEASRYPYTGSAELRAAVAAAHGVREDHVLLGCGSTEILRIATDAFTGATRPLVTGAPTYEEPTSRATVLGIPIRAVPVDAELRLDLAGMTRAAAGAGMVFLCNPNNPTGTVHGAAAIADTVRRIRAESPEATIVIDEAYHEYVEDPSYATALPLALGDPRVVVVRTFSKVYGLAGLRVGYAVARPETITAMARHRLGNSVSVLAAAAAKASLADRELVPRERRLNAEARDFTRRFFERAGYRVTPSQTNFVMVDIRRDARAFQAACRARDVLVGRPFPPLTTHARISIGTLDEMRAATGIFEQVLGAA